MGGMSAGAGASGDLSAAIARNASRRVGKAPCRSGRVVRRGDGLPGAPGKVNKPLAMSAYTTGCPKGHGAHDAGTGKGVCRWQRGEGCGSSQAVPSCPPFPCITSTAVITSPNSPDRVSTVNSLVRCGERGVKRPLCLFLRLAAPNLHAYLYYPALCRSETSLQKGVS
jgi:hypothetical protein